MRPKRYLAELLADGARPFLYRGGVRRLLGMPEDTGVQVRFPGTGPAPGLSPLRPRFMGAAELPDQPLAAGRDPQVTRFVVAPRADASAYARGPVVRVPLEPAAEPVAAGPPAPPTAADAEIAALAHDEPGHRIPLHADPPAAPPGRVPEPVVPAPVVPAPVVLAPVVPEPVVPVLVVVRPPVPDVGGSPRTPDPPPPATSRPTGRAGAQADPAPTGPRWHVGHGEPGLRPDGRSGPVAAGGAPLGAPDGRWADRGNPSPDPPHPPGPGPAPRRPGPAGATEGAPTEASPAPAVPAVRLPGRGAADEVPVTVVVPPAGPQDLPGPGERRRHVMRETPPETGPAPAAVPPGSGPARGAPPPAAAPRDRRPDRGAAPPWPVPRSVDGIDVDLLPRLRTAPAPPAPPAQDRTGSEHPRPDPRLAPVPPAQPVPPGPRGALTTGPAGTPAFWERRRLGRLLTRAWR